MPCRNRLLARGDVLVAYEPEPGVVQRGPGGIVAEKRPTYRINLRALGGVTRAPQSPPGQYVVFSNGDLFVTGDIDGVKRFNAATGSLVTTFRDEEWFTPPGSESPIHIWSFRGIAVRPTRRSAFASTSAAPFVRGARSGHRRGVIATARRGLWLHTALSHTFATVASARFNFQRPCALPCVPYDGCASSDSLDGTRVRVVLTSTAAPSQP
jgi:hypothetical protein